MKKSIVVLLFTFSSTLLLGQVNFDPSIHNYSTQTIGGIIDFKAMDRKRVMHATEEISPSIPLALDVTLKYDQVMVRLDDFEVSIDGTYYPLSSAVPYKWGPEEPTWRKFFHIRISNPKGGNVPGGIQIRGKVTFYWPK